jgi:hypothetical protein
MLRCTHFMHPHGPVSLPPDWLDPRAHVMIVALVCVCVWVITAVDTFVLGEAQFIFKHFGILKQHNE